MAKEKGKENLRKATKVARIQNVRSLIVARMNRRGLTAYALAKLARSEMTEQAVRAYVSGKSDMRGEKLAVLLSVLGLEIRPKESR